MADRRCTAWAGLIALLAVLPAAAQETPRTDDDTLRITITPTRRPAPLAERPESTSIIERADIEARPSAGVPELLSQVPGVSIDQPGGPGGVSSLYLRGTDPNHTLVLIDGIRANDPTNTRGGSFDLSTLDPLTVERIEVVRGPLSSVYGSDAIGGVLNIITREGRAFQQNGVSLGIGTDGYRRGAAFTSGPVSETLRFAVTGGILDHGDPVEGNALINRTLNAKLHSTPRADTRLTLVGRFADTDARSFPDDSGGPRFAVFRESDRRSIKEATIGGGIDHPLTDWWRLDLSAGFLWREEEVTSPGVAPGIRDPFGIPRNSSDNRYRRLTFTAANRFEPMAGLRLGLGAGIERESGTSRGSLEFGPGFTVPTSFTLDRNIGNVFGEAEYALGALVLSAGMRMDMPQGFEPAYSPRVGALYRFDSTGTTLKANWGKGFRLPSFFALRHPLVGNPTLQPEKSTGWDVGVVQDFDDGKSNVGLTYFHNHIRSLIDLEEGPPLRLVNRSAATSRGVELSANWQMTQSLSAHGQVTYTRITLDGGAEALRNRPKWRGAGELRWRPLEQWQFGASVVRVGSVFDSSIPTGDVTLAPYTVVGATATWSPRPDLHLQLALDNLLDADYEQAVGFPAPGRQVRATVRVTF